MEKFILKVDSNPSYVSNNGKLETSAQPIKPSYLLYSCTHLFSKAEASKVFGDIIPLNLIVNEFINFPRKENRIVSAIRYFSSRALPFVGLSSYIFKLLNDIFGWVSFVYST